MQIDFKKAFTYPFKDNDKLKKFSIGISFSLILSILSLTNITNFFYFYNTVPTNIKYLTLGISIFLAVPTTLILLGYYILILNNTINNRTPLLPDWNLINCLKYGFLGYIIEIIYGIPIKIIGFVYSYISKSIITHQNVSLSSFIFPDYFFNIFFNNPLFFLLTVFFFIFLLIIFAITIFAKNHYAEDFKFKNGFSINKILLGIYKVIPEYLVILAIVTILHGISLPFIINFIKSFAIMSPNNNFRSIEILMFISCLRGIWGFIFSLFFYNLYAQVYKLAKHRVQLA